VGRGEALRNGLKRTSTRNMIREGKKDGNDWKQVLGHPAIAEKKMLSPYACWGGEFAPYSVKKKKKEKARGASRPFRTGGRKRKKKKGTCSFRAVAGRKKRL